MTDGWQAPPAHGGFPPQGPPASPAPMPPQGPPPPQGPAVPQWPTVAPGSAATASPQPSATPPKSKTPLVIGGVAAGCLLLVCACASVVFAGLSLSSCSESKPWTLTPDQQRVMKEFGPPEAFTVAFVSDLETPTPEKKDPPMLRLETWQYPSLGSEFSFRDGTFQRRAKIAVPKGALQTPALRPDAFAAAMSPDQVSKIVDSKPSRTATVLPDLFKGLEVQSYLGQVVAGYQDGKLVVIQVFPVTAKGGSK